MADLSQFSTEDLIALYQQQLRLMQQQAVTDADPLSQGARNFAADMPMGQQALAGAGMRVADRMLGAKELFSTGDRTERLREEAAQKRITDAPLRGTAGGNLGALGMDVASLAPTAFMPGANTMMGAGAIGAASGFLEPTTSLSEGASTAIGNAGAAMGGQYLGNKIAGAFTPRDIPQRTQTAMNAAQKYGYVVPPMDVAPQSFVNRRLSGLAGKDLVQQEASVRNQEVTNKLARAIAGLREDDPLTSAALGAQREAQGRAYEAVAQTPRFNWTHAFEKATDKLGRQGQSVLPNRAAQEIDKIIGGLDRGSFTGRELVDTVKHLRNEASSSFKAANMPGGNPISEALGQAQKEAADLLETLAQSNFKAQGNTDLIPALKAARQQIAKLHTIERALHESTGNVSAAVLRREMARGGMSGPLKEAAQFSEAFPAATRLPEQIGSVGTNSLLQTGADTAALAAALASHNPMPLAASGVPMLRKPAANLLLSRGYQKYMVDPRTSIGGRVNSAIAGPNSQALAQALALASPQAGILIPKLYDAYAQ